MQRSPTGSVVVGVDGSPEALVAARYAVGQAARAEILALFPELADGAPVQGARPFLTGRQGRALAVQHGGVALQ